MAEWPLYDSRMTYLELLDRLLVHRPWIEAQGVPTGHGSRFAGLCNAVDFVDESYRSGRVGELMDAATNSESIWGLVEATEFEAALRRLRPLGPVGLPQVLQTALVGENAPDRIPTTPDGEGESAVTRARNDVFQPRGIRRAGRDRTDRPAQTTDRMQATV